MDRSLIDSIGRPCVAMHRSQDNSPQTTNSSQDPDPPTAGDFVDDAIEFVTCNPNGDPTIVIYSPMRNPMEELGVHVIPSHFIPCSFLKKNNVKVTTSDVKEIYLLTCQVPLANPSPSASCTLDRGTFALLCLRQSNPLLLIRKQRRPRSQIRPTHGGGEIILLILSNLPLKGRLGDLL